MSGNGLQKLSYILLIILLFGLTTGVLGGL
ncbi:hypothetical protein TRP8649_04062 [Pelagimonas phthalicica]|uniref:Uncharacterized protein n=1 Tax=Pelagimonas phthalicica TaxID=1037362 RepID=A0A238JJ07_9RHOB|nr:hypothetical protein CLV87_3806 [Pelagimonas phthalicica]SMX29922.1 hypothetical protein TRP8649_04062 [Pelagimonas phthalicica]